MQCPLPTFSLAGIPVFELAPLVASYPPTQCHPTPLPMQHKASTAEPRPYIAQDGRHVVHVDCTQCGCGMRAACARLGWLFKSIASEFLKGVRMKSFLFYWWLVWVGVPGIPPESRNLSP